MASVNNVPRDIQDSIREILGTRVKLFIKRMVKQEVKPEKWESRVMVFSGCRLFVFIPKTPAKLESNFNYLDLQAIESRKQNQLSLTVDGKTYNFVTLDTETEEVNHMITHVAVSLRNIFPDFTVERLIKKIEVIPPERIRMMTDMTKNISKETGPCGGFTMMYACMCDYHSLPFRAEVEWDIDMIYLSQDSRELCLQDFDHLDLRDLVPILGALEHNTWFTKIDANDVKLTLDAQSVILKVMRKNAVINELCLSNSGIGTDFVQKLSTAILSNSSTPLHSIDLSKNVLDDRAIIHLIVSLGSLCRGLVRFDISHTKVTGKGLNKIAETLSHNAVVGSRFQYLNFADNPAKGDDLQKLYHYLASPNTLTHLDLSGIDCALEHLCGPLLLGCCATLTHLSLARNTFSHKKPKEISVPLSWKKFFSSVYDLRHLDISGCKLPSEPLRELLLGVASNINQGSLHLDLSSNELMVQGSMVMESCVSTISCLRSLDISNNGIGQGMVSMLNWIRNNKEMKHLAIGRNFENVRPKNLPSVMDAVVQLIQDHDAGIESLSLADSKLKTNISVFLNTLGSNQTLVEIDISGNQMGDFGARMLSKTLQINTKLRTIMWDKNATTAQGFEDIAGALEKNYTMKKMPTPINDAATALKQQPERTEAALQKIEMLLQRNHSPQKYSSDQGFRMQQGFLVSSAQQTMDRLVVQNQDTVNALNLDSTEPFQVDMDAATSAIKDAGNSKQLLPQLQVIANKSLSPGNPVEACMKEMSETLKQVLEKHMKKIVEDMFECTRKQCATIKENKEVLADLQTICSEKSSFPKDFTKHILDSVETEIFNKLSELNLVVATHISDKVMDEVTDTLSSSHKTLTNHLNVMKSGTPIMKNRGSKVEKLDSKDAKEVGEKLDVGKEKSDSQEMIFPKTDSSPTRVRSRREVVNKDSPILVVADRRKSKMTRLIRPPTVIVGSTEDLIQSQLNKPEIIVEETPSLTPSLPPSSEPIDLSGISDTGPKLTNHPGKSRPKRQKVNQSRRPGAMPVVTDGLRADEGMDSFYNRQTVKEHSVTATVVEIPRSQSTKSTTDNKVKKVKSWKEKDVASKEPKPKGGFASLFTRTKKKTVDESGKSDDSTNHSKTKGSSPDRSSSSKVAGLFDRNSKVRLSPFRSKRKDDKKGDKSPDRNMKSAKEEEKIEVEVASTESEKDVPREPTPEPEVKLEPPSEPEPKVEPNVEPESPKEPKQAMKPKFGVGGPRPIGFGENMMQQLKLTKRFSQSNVLDDDDSSPKASSPSTISQGSSPSPQNNGSPKAPTLTPKPKPAPRVRSSNTDEVTGAMDRKSQDGRKLPPKPLKPRPPKSAKPTNSPQSTTPKGSVSDDSMDGENKPTEGKKEEEDVEVDSQPLRMSKEEKIKKMGLETNAQSFKKKSTSLPRDKSLPIISKEKGESPEWKHRSVHDPMNVSTTSEDLSPLSVSSDKKSDSFEKLNGDKDNNSNKTSEKGDNNGNKEESSPPDTDNPTGDDVIMV